MCNEIENIVAYISRNEISGILERNGKKKRKEDSILFLFFLSDSIFLIPGNKKGKEKKIK